MATADKYVNLSVNRILGVDRFKTEFLDFLRNHDKDIVASVFASSGVFDALTLIASGADEFDISGFSGKGIVGIDGAGNFLDLDARSADFVDIKFENQVTVTYHVGMKAEILPESLAVSPADGVPHWDRMEEVVGWEGTPDGVVDNLNGTMTFKVNRVTEDGTPNISNAGRKVAVYKKVLEKSAVVYAKALEICTVVWDATDNKITTTTWATGGAGDFGQDSPSTTTGDYVVVLIGPRVSRGTDLRTLPAWCYVGNVTGAGAGNPPSTFDTTEQNLMAIPLSDLTQITRYESVPPDRLKIDVQALAGESGVDQIRVTKLGTGVMFKVNEAGDVTMEGDLTVKGTTTQEDVVQVNSSETITDNLTAGDADTDTHAIQGEWTHSTDGGVATAFAIDGDTGRIGIGGAYDGTNALKVTGSMGMTGNLLPIGSVDIGSTTDLFQAIYGEKLSVRSAAPTIQIYDTGAASNEKLWAIRVDTGDDLEFTTLTDIGATGSVFMKVTRGTATAVTQIDIYEPTYLNDSLFAQSIVERVAGGGNYSLGASDRPWGEIIGQEIRARITSGVPRVYLEELDQSDARENWGIAASIGDLIISAYNNDKSDSNPAIHIHRDTGDVYTVHDVQFFVPLLTISALPLIIEGSSGNTFFLDMITFETGIGTNEGRWRLTTTDDGGGDLKLVTLTDAAGAGADVLKFIRGSGTAFASLLVYGNLHCGSDGGGDLGTTGNRWGNANLSGNMIASQARVSADPGSGSSSSVTFTGVTTSAVSSGTGTVKMDTANNADSIGWLKIFVATDTRWMPFWTTNAP